MYRSRPDQWKEVVHGFGFNRERSAGIGDPQHGLPHHRDDRASGKTLSQGRLSHVPLAHPHTTPRTLRAALSRHCPRRAEQHPGGVRRRILVHHIALEYQAALAWSIDGAGDGNRTHVNSLEGCRTTIVLRPLLDLSPGSPEGIRTPGIHLERVAS